MRSDDAVDYSAIDPPRRWWPVDPSSPLLQMNNVVATPHMGSATHETREAMAACAVDNLIDALQGKRPANLVNPQAWPVA